MDDKAQTLISIEDTDDPSETSAEFPDSDTDKTAKVTEISDRGREITLHYVKDIVDITLKIVLVLAVVGGAWEYFEKQHENKVRHALRIVDDWEGQQYSSDYEYFNKVASKLIKAGKDKFGDDKNATFRFVSNRFDKAIQNKAAFLNIFSSSNEMPDQQISHDKFLKTVDRLNYFFGKAGLCVQDTICEASLMKRYFGKSACDFRNVSSAYIARTRFKTGNIEFARLSEHLCGMS